MQVQSINTGVNTNFQAKQRLLTKEAHQNMQNLLHKMNAETVYSEPNNCSFISAILRSVKLGEKASFHDGRILPKECAAIFGSSVLKFGKTELIIDNKTGEISESSKKPFFKSWDSILETASDYIQMTLENFDNEAHVEKNFVRIAGTTEKGSERIHQAQNVVEHTIRSGNGPKAGRGIQFIDIEF